MELYGKIKFALMCLLIVLVSINLVEENMSKQLREKKCVYKGNKLLMFRTNEKLMM